VCSAFLVGPDTIVSAGHCINAEAACPYATYVFGAGYDDKTRDPRQIDRDNVYFCEGVLSRAASGIKGDYAVVKLDRPVVGRAPLLLRRAGKIADDEELVLIGNPLGLPTKIAAHGKVIDNTKERFFKSNTDSYGGGSGSVVMGVRSGLAEGVLVRGEKDFEQKGDCWVSKVCPEEASACRGEDVSRATEFAGYVLSVELDEAGKPR
jgi:V8-like Glu-specific endopeptidase